MLVFDPTAISSNTSSNVSPEVLPEPESEPNQVAFAFVRDGTSDLVASPYVPHDRLASDRFRNGVSPILLVQSTGSATPFQAPAGEVPSYAPGQGAISPSTTPGFAGAGNPNWDPYARPGGGPLFSSQTSSEFFEKVPEQSKLVARRFVEKVTLDFTFLPGGNDNKGFGINELAYQTEFYFPTCFLPDQAPIYLVPGANLYWWDGPLGIPHERRDMSPNGFGAYLESGSAFNITEQFAVELWGRLGVYSDTEKIVSDSVRLSGQGSIVVGLTKDVQGVFGLIYLNRQRIKMLPRVGVIWKPNSEVVWQLVFPNPKLSRYVTRINNTDWWFYLCGDYGGGIWTITEDAQDTFLTDYNDIRIGVGLEFTNHAFINGFIEFGGAFGRELYSDGTAWCKPPSTIYLKAGFHF